MKTYRLFPVALLLTLLALLLGLAPARAATPPNAWQIVDDSATGFLQYTNILPANQRIAATNQGWRFSVVNRILSGGGASTHRMSYRDGTRRFRVSWSLNANGALTASLGGTNAVPVLTPSGQATNDYHTHELVYDPVRSDATYRFDGNAVLTWPGEILTAQAGTALWGADSGIGLGRGNYHRVQFAINGLGTISEYNAGFQPTNPVAPNPTNQGWSLVATEALTATLTNVSVAPDLVALRDLKAWQITDNVTTADRLNYTTNLAPSLVQTATNLGWRYSMTSRLVDDFGATVAMFMVFGDGTRRHGLGWDFNAAKDTLVVNLLGGGTTNVALNAIDATADHTHELIRTNGVVNYFLDGRFIATSPGDTAAAQSNQVFWGSAASGGKGQVYFHRAEFWVNGAGRVAAFNAGNALDPGVTPSPQSQGWTRNVTGSGVTEKSIPLSATFTIISSSVNPSLAGSDVTFIATVKQPDNVAVTNGTVSFGALAPDVPLNASGQAIFSTSALAEGDHVVTAAYTPGSGYLGSSATVTQRVDNVTVRVGSKFSNPGALTVPPTGSGTAGVYPSRIFVSGLSGAITGVTLDLNGINIDKLDDLELLLVAQSGQNFVLLGDAGGATPLAGINLTFSDTAASPVPDATAPASGTYRPSSYDPADDFASAPAGMTALPPPFGPYPHAAPQGSSTFASIFAGISPNQTWSLYLYDDVAGGGISVNNGWSLTFTTTGDTATTTALTSAPNPSIQGSVATFTATVRRSDNNAAVTSGAVTFREGATILASGVALNGSGQASFSTSSLAAGERFISADYTGLAGSFGLSTATLAHRVCPTNITVTRTNDNGPGSLRQALLDLCPGGTIDFTNTLNDRTIVLTNGELVIRTNMSILGPGATNLTISGGGSSRVFSVGPGATSVVAGLSISNGNGAGAASSGSGGGILNRGTLTVSNCTLSGNSATNGSGGGIFNNGSTLTVQHSTISGNSATSSGGGIQNYATLTIQNSTLSRNLSTSHGGGIQNYNTLTIQNSTLTGNSASSGEGGGIHIGSSGTVEQLTNCIVAGNFRGGTPNDIEGGTVDSAAYNAIGSSTYAGGIINGVNGNIVGNAGGGTLAITSILDTNLIFHGGPTRTHALVPGSPALNTGTNVASQPAYDQRGPGFPRRVNGRVDVGAFEVQAPLYFTQIVPVPAGMSLRVQGATNEPLQIQWNNLPGRGGWNPLTTGTTDGTGLLEHTNTGVGAVPQRFYRAVRP